VLNANSESIGGSGMGTFNHSAGTNNAFSDITLGSSIGGGGIYNLNGSGQLNSSLENVGFSGMGVFNHSAGVNTITDTLFLGVQTGGSGTYNLSGTGQLNTANENIGNSGSGTFNQSAGIHSVTGLYFVMGNTSGSSGIYNLSGTGQLNTPHENIGVFGTGTFNQSAGTNATPFILLGSNPGATGTYNLSGSGQLNVGNVTVGVSGTGTFTQSGGINTVQDFLMLASQSGSSGTYNLTGGTLVLKSIYKGSGAAAFNFGGGTLRASDYLFIDLPVTLTGIGGNANFDTAGYWIDDYGVVSGPGGLNKLGEDWLEFDDPISYSGDTTVKGGGLAIVGGIDDGGTKLIDVQSGVALLVNTNVIKPDLNISTAALATFWVFSGAHTVGAISGSGITKVDAGASLTAASISQGTLTLGSGATLTIQPIPGGPLGGAIIPVPEPNTIILFGAALIMLCYAGAKKVK
jgi:hypothetical protein